MLKHVVAACSLLAVAANAGAEPVRLDTAELDAISVNPVISELMITGLLLDLREKGHFGVTDPDTQLVAAGIDLSHLKDRRDAGSAGVGEAGESEAARSSDQPTSSQQAAASVAPASAAIPASIGTASVGALASLSQPAPVSLDLASRSAPASLASNGALATASPASIAQPAASGASGLAGGGLVAASGIGSPAATVATSPAAPIPLVTLGTLGSVIDPGMRIEPITAAGLPNLMRSNGAIGGGLSGFPSGFHN